MSYSPLREENRKKDMMFEIAMIMAASVYIGLLIGSEMKYRNLESVIDMFSYLSDDLMGNRKMFVFELPGFLCIFPCDIKWVLFSLLIGAVFSFNRYVDYIFKKNTRPGEEHGSAGFNTDYKRFLKNFVMNPDVLKKGLTDGKIRISFFDFLYAKIGSRLFK